jgi:hydroxyacylglutathione hydrolase
METGFKAHIGQVGERFKLGNVTIELLHTPGHTMESSCYLLRDESGKEVAIFTGDTLFIGDVGRPDLAQHAIADMTEEKLAGHLYNSVHHKIMPLNDDIIVYPSHGAGSACGKNMSKETFDTLGHQKHVNYELNPKLTKEEFKKQLLDGLMPPPGYFPQNVLMNIKGYESIDNVMKKGTQDLNAKEFEAADNTLNALIIDTRKADDFCKSFIPNAINIGIDGSFATWVGTLVPSVNHPILLVADEGREEEIVTRLARVGYDNALGYLKGGMKAW